MSKYYEMLKVTPEKELANTWEEITEKDYNYWAEVVVPAHWEMHAVVTGEPTCDGVDGVIHETCVTISGRYFRRPATIELFDLNRYIAEIKEQFGIERAW